MGRLNSAEGIGGLVATVQALTGIRIDHYATVDMAGFGSLSTAVGGVDVCLRAASHDSFSGADFPAGRQTLSGPRALAFLRQRAGLPNGDLDRVVRQQDFLRALVAKVSSGDTLRDPKALAALLTAVRENVEVDQGWDLAAFARQLAANPAAGLATIPVTIRNDAGTLNLDPGAVRIFVGDFLAGTPKPGNDSAGSPPVDPCVG
jgi:LCP family protein required for cell wall assembly